MVLAGGAARRLGGADKPGLDVAGRPLLDRVLEACEGAVDTVVVGPRRPTVRPVLWAREEPPGGGPLPALAAGLVRTGSDTVLVFAADMPFLTRSTADALREALRRAQDAEGADDADGVDGVVLTDPSGRDQPLAAAYRTEALRRGLALIATEHGTLAGLPLRLLAEELRLHRLPDPSGSDSFDCDTWDDVAVARARLEQG